MFLIVERGEGAGVGFGVKRRNTRSEHIFSGLPPRADSSRTSLEVRLVPNSEVALPLKAARRGEVLESWNPAIPDISTSSLCASANVA